MIWLLRKFSYRLYHAVMKIAALVLPFPEPELLVGEGSLQKLPLIIKKYGIKKAVIVTDEVLVKLGLISPLLTSMDAAGVLYEVYDAVEPDPTTRLAENLRDFFLFHKAEAFIAFGGGSAIDCAKAAAARCNTKRTLRQMKGYLKVYNRVPPIYAVPTTSGTGSEGTIAAVITDETSHRKFVVGALKLVPKAAVLDPVLTVGLPGHITAATGMDALTHAVEAFIGIHKTSYTDNHAREAVRMIFSNLYKVYKQGDDIAARLEMAKASYYAGLAFTRASVGYVHAIAHNLGALYGIPHGLANAMVLPSVLDWFYDVSKQKYAELAEYAGICQKEDSLELKSRAFVDYIKDLNRKLRIPKKIKELKARDIPFIAKRAIKEGNPTYPVPKIMNYDECENILWNLLE